MVYIYDGDNNDKTIQETPIHRSSEYTVDVDTSIAAKRK